MKYAILFLLLAACGASGSPAAAPTDTAPDFDAVPLAADSEPWTTETGGFGARVYFAGTATALGWAANEGDQIAYLSSVFIEAGEEWALEEDDAGSPPAGWLYVQAMVAGWKYAALVYYVPGYNDGWTITRNDLWFD